jgi:hypothetical protein
MLDKHEVPGSNPGWPTKSKKQTLQKDCSVCYVFALAIYPRSEGSLRAGLSDRRRQGKRYTSRDRTKGRLVLGELGHVRSEPQQNPQG